MAEELKQIPRFLDRLSERERRLLLLRGLIQALIVLVAGLLLVAVALTLGAARDGGLAIAALAGLGALTALAWPLSRWKEAGDRWRQARLIEGMLPQLRSRLLTALDWSETGGVGLGASLALAQRATARASEAALAVQPAQVHPIATLKPLFYGLLAALAALGVGFLLPVTPADAIAVLLKGQGVVFGQDEPPSEDPDERALVGDITLSYTFPDYTGLPPLVVKNSDGTIHAPPGTRVQITARSAEAFDAVALQAYGEEPVEARLADGRQIEASLEVKGEGIWRFKLVRGREAQFSPDFRIVVDEDAPPVVSLNNSQPRSAPLNQPLNLGWVAQDDFGISRVVVEVEENGQVREYPLRQPLDTTTDLRGQVMLSPQDLGLKPGSKAKIRVVAYDNDRLAQSKRGASVEVEVEVLGPQAQGKQLMNIVRQLRDAMVPVLADFLEEPVPPAPTDAGMLKWAEKARLRFEPIQALMKKQWGDQQPSSTDGVLVNDVLEAASRLVRFTVTAYDPSSGRESAGSGKDDATFAQLHAEQVQELERAIYLLDEMLRRVARQEIAQQAGNVANEARELQEFAETNPTSEALLARLDQLERLMAQLARQAAQLDEGQLQEFVNSRTEEAGNLMEEIRKAIAEGRTEDAKKMLAQLSEMLQQMAEGLDAQINQQQQGDDATQKAIEQLMKDLESLEAQQQQLAEQLAKARSQEGDQANEQADMWERIQELAEKADSSARSAVESTGAGEGWRAASITRVTRFQEATQGVLDAARARDANAAAQEADRALRQSEIALGALEDEFARARPPSEAVPGGVNAALEATRASQAALLELLKLLEQLQNSQQEESQAMQELARQLAQQQEQLGQQQQQLQQKVQQLEQALPTADGTASEQMQQAGQAMEEAGDRLSEGQSMPGEGHQRDAANRLRAAREALQQQMDQYQQMQQRMQQMQGQGQGQGQEGQREGQEGQEIGQHEIFIPAPEEFQTPAEYRRALLEGMEEAVPEEYEALKKRYYEELVNQ